MEKTYTEQEFTGAIRAAIEDRAKWFFLLLKHAKDLGCNVEEVAKRAITEFGIMKGQAIGKASDAKQLAQAILSGPPNHAFAMDPVKLEEEESVIRFNYCPLVEAWRKLGCSPQEVAQLCKLARYGDYAMVGCFLHLSLEFKALIAEGQNYCEIVIRRKGVHKDCVESQE
ncbi:MAG: L-2-amino-thiazoline-4-carboxylic acid hydrolase [Bacillota bacterium]